MHIESSQIFPTISDPNFHTRMSSNDHEPRSSFTNLNVNGRGEYVQISSSEKMSDSVIDGSQTLIEPLSTMQLSGPGLCGEETICPIESTTNMESHTSRTFPMASKQLKNKKYHFTNRESLLERQKEYYQCHKNKILRKSRRSDPPKRDDKNMEPESHYEIMHKNDYEVESFREARRKYPPIHGKSTDVLLKCKERYITKLIENLDSPCTAENRIQADQLVTRCIHVTGDRVLELKRVMKKLSTKCELAVPKLGDVSISDNVEFGTSILCGKPNHHSTTAPYFLETAYDTSMLNQWRETDIDGLDDVSREVRKKPLIMDEKGKVTNILLCYVKAGKISSTWTCDDYCRKVDVDILREVKSLFEEIIGLGYPASENFCRNVDTCTSETRNSDKRGHPITCYVEPLTCASKLLKIDILSCHYPSLHTVKRMIYEVKHLYNWIGSIELALAEGDFASLLQIREESEDVQVQCSNTEGETCLDEVELTRRYLRGIEELTRIDQDPPSIPCISCERLCTSRYVDRVEKHLIENDFGYFGLKSTSLMYDLIGGGERDVDETWWEKLQDLYDSQYSRESFICHFCIGKLKKNQLPSLSIMNGLLTDKTPPEIQTLNRFEDVLIQRAKAFQTIVKLETVQKENIPHYMKLDQIKGRTFHLPLPLEATLEKLCRETDPINMNHEMFILVRSNPTKRKVVWEDHVDITKVWTALELLKSEYLCMQALNCPVHRQNCFNI
ncbi:hypothetical protein QAD02_020780 [Eretmocerus hayati]|uniref:Uncharacterized protein n=1 Tax=Eretmocerus hayati TaxID=131215 RepID=A0ACC2PRK7_9HYME|nr:hypothetical protein QAD02_020780 [Eretmocerus hayati]